MTAELAAPKVLIISKQDVLIDVVSVFLEGLFQATITVIDNSRSLETMFEQGNHKGLNLLLVEDDRILKAAGKNIADFMAPTIMFGSEDSEKPPTGRKLVFLKKPLDLEKLVKAIQSFAQSAGVAKKEYCQIRLETLLLSGKEMKQDVYNLKADGSYEAVLKKGEIFDPNNAIHFELRKQKFLYLKFEDFSTFVTEFAQELQKLAASTKDKVFDLGSSVAVTRNVHEMVAQIAPELGFTKELQEAAKVSVDLAVSAMKKDTKLADLFEALSKSDSEYLTWHSTTLCYIACRLSNLMTWDSPNTHYKLSLAAFLHDITIKDTKLARVKTIEELKIATLDEAERASYMEHPHEAAAHARSMKDFHGDVDQIVAQHHELPNGKGFPLGLTHTKISPMAAVFIVAHDITDELYDKRTKFNMKETVKKLEANYTHGYFRRVVGSLVDLAKREGSL